jgi:hypothetical protein
VQPRRRTRSISSTQAKPPQKLSCSRTSERTRQQKEC